MTFNGTGTTITFGTTAFAGKITSVDGWERTRDTVATTHMGTTVAKTYEPGDLYDAGEMNVTIEHEGELVPPIMSTAENVTVAWAGIANTDVASGFMTAFSVNAPLEDTMTGSYTIKFTGAIT